MNTLRLNRNAIDKEAVEKIAQSLSVNQCLTYLDVSDNNFGVFGCNELFNCLKDNRGLLQVHLNNVGMTDDGHEALYNCIKFNGTCSVLGLCKNGFTNRTASRICAALKVNSGIKEIELWGNEIDDDKKREVYATCVDRVNPKW